MWRKALARLADVVKFPAKRDLDTDYPCDECGDVVPAFAGVRSETAVFCSSACEFEHWSLRVW